MKKRIRKVFLLKDIAVLAAMSAAGAACLFIGEGWSGAGVLIFLCVLMMLPFCRHGYRIEDRKGVFHGREILLARENRDEILAWLDGTADRLDLHPRVPGGALVEIYIRKKDGLTLARYFDYNDFINGTEYPLHEITAEQVACLETFSTDKK